MAFLKQLRAEKTETLLWMDVLCINQEDTRERELQVAMMHDIFRSANRVQAWLGVEAEDSALAMEHARSLDTVRLLESWKEVRLATFRASHIPKPDSLADALFNFDGSNEGLRNQMINACVQLVCRPWLRQVWIQQEIVSARHAEVHCGASTISWNQYMCLIWKLYYFSTAHPELAVQDLFHHIATARDCASSIQLYRTQRPSLLSMNSLYERLHNCWACEASDPRDKIFATLDLAPIFDSIEEHDEFIQITPDYSSSWEQLYTYVSALLFSNEASLLTYAGFAGFGQPSQHRSKHLPTWAVDWRKRPYVYLSPAMWDAGRVPTSLLVPDPSFASLRDSETWVHRLCDATTTPAAAMSVQSLLVDTVMFITTCMTDKSIKPRAVRVKQRLRSADDESLQHLHGRKSFAYINGEESRLSYQNTIICGTSDDANLVEAGYCERGHAEWRDWMGSDHVTTIPEYCHNMDSKSYGKCTSFAVTNQGYFCFVSSTTKVGDCIALLAHSSVGVTLRHVPGPIDVTLGTTESFENATCTV